ncbi:MAG: aminopeptidase P family protein [Deltaproteobacteria bacterium]|nr:aminopeptidase P family protein [Deltaproteobacteria bacterium]
MQPATYKARMSNLRRRLASSRQPPYDSAWIIQPENRRYLSGFEAEDSQFTESSGSLFIAGDRCLLVTDSRYTTEAENEAIGFTVYTVEKSLVQDLPHVMAQLDNGVMGFEQGYVTWQLHREVSEKLSESAIPVTLEPLHDMVEEMRVVKDREEVNAIEASARMMSEILGRVIPALEPGRTEADVAWSIRNLAREAGADDLSFPSIVASGPNSALPHAVPTERRLQAGEPIVLDVGVRLKGYCSDMTRTVFLGEPSSEFRTVYKTVREAQLAGMAEIRPGVESTRPDAVAREVIADAGYGAFFGHSLGHGVGLATHERPRLGPQKPVELKKGMVMTVEPGIYLPGKGGVRLEEMVVVEEDGARLLTSNRDFYDF